MTIHSTGAGIAARFKREGQRKGDANYFATAMRVYTTITPYSGHYTVGQNSECMQNVPEEYVAMHVGRRGAWAYRFKRWAGRRFRWWTKRFPALSSPLRFLMGQLWQGRSVNDNTIGIEVVHAKYWTEPCMRKLAALVADICARHGIPPTHGHILGHCETHPRPRTTKRSGKPFDPKPEQWTWQVFAPYLEEAVAARAAQ